ncbi:MAG: diguanylate cyclase [Hyphomicrobiaceae bacterium]
MASKPSSLTYGDSTVSEDTLVRSLLRENERLQQALNAERDRSRLFESIFKCLPDAIAFTRPDRSIRMTNPGFRELFGYEHDEIHGSTTAQLYSSHDEYKKQGRSRFHLSAEEQLKPYEVEYKTKHGRQFTGETIGTPLRDEDQNVIGYLGIIRDVTERARKANEVLEQEQLLRQITEALPELVVYIDRDGFVRFMNATAERWYDCCKSDMIGKDVLEIFGQESSDKIRPLLEQALQGKVIRERLLISYPDQQNRTVELSYMPHRSASGEVVGLVALAVNVTAQTKVEEELSISKQRLNDAIDAIPDAFAYYDKDDVLRIFNAQYRALYPLSKEYIYEGATFEEIIRGGVANGQYRDAIGKEDEWIANRMAEHANPQTALEQRLGDGRWVRVEERKTKDGGRVGVRVDVTQLKETEQELRHLSVTDHLTGISNRRKFLSDLKAAHGKVRQDRGTYSLVMIDVDHFKNVNDTFGHAMGDQVLKRLSQLIKSELRPLDQVCRYGGEEFVVLLPDTSIGGAFSTAERIRNAAKDQLFETDGQSIQITISVGATQIDSRDEQFDAALARADSALYQAKELGRDRVIILPLQ